jgi:hypothetical protein
VDEQPDLEQPGQPHVPPHPLKLRLAALEQRFDALDSWVARLRQRGPVEAVDRSAGRAIAV